ncbi:hypothetical protein Ancab_035990 [Ancistrocladus abbreviatus]
MSTSSKSDSDNSTFDIEELLNIGQRCGEMLLRKESDSLKETQSQSFELIRRLEFHVKRLTESQAEDKKQIQELEKELSSCYEEIGYLQDRLNARNAEFDFLGGHMSSLESKIENLEISQEEIDSLRQDLKRSNLECSFLKQQLDNREVELQKSMLYLETLEESISSAALESECEIESMKLEMVALEQNCFDAKKSEKESAQEKARVEELIRQLESQIEDARRINENLGKENKELKAMLSSSEKHARLFCERIREHFTGWLECNVVPVNALSYSDENEPIASEEVSMYGDVLGPLLLKLLMLRTSDLNLKDDCNEMLQKIREYEQLVKKLKDELKEEKFKAKEEAEDLTQEMAELRYQMTEMLEEECKRRAFIEQASIQRIAELEARIEAESIKSSAPIGHESES